MISQTLLAVFLAAAVHAGVVPTAPGPGMSFTEGSDCSFSWQLDTTGKWTSFSVDLMSGSNMAMNVVQNVFKDHDGTKGPASYTFKCPKVTPNSAIYFYQFSQAGADTTWTTRFTLKDASGQSTPPASSTQPDGKAIPWGTGALEGAASDSGATPAAGANTTMTPAAGNMTVLTTPPSAGNATASISSTSPDSTVGTTLPSSNTTSSTSAPTQSTSSSTNPAQKNTSASSPSSSSTTASTTGSTAGSGASTTSSVGRVCVPGALVAALMGASLALGC